MTNSKVPEPMLHRATPCHSTLFRMQWRHYKNNKNQVHWPHSLIWRPNYYLYTLLPIKINQSQSTQLVDPVSICGEQGQPQIGMEQSRQPLSGHFHHRNLWSSQSANCIWNAVFSSHGWTFAVWISPFSLWAPTAPGSTRQLPRVCCEPQGCTLVLGVPRV